MKKTIIITSIAITLTILGFFAFSMLREKPTETEVETEKGLFSFFLPKAEEKPFTLPSVPEAEQEELTPEEQAALELPVADLTQLTQEAVSRGAFNEKTDKVRYFEKSTGHIYEINPQGKEKTQLTITTIPKIFEVFWLNDASKAVIQYIDEDDNINTFSIYSLSTTTPPTEEGSETEEGEENLENEEVETESEIWQTEGVFLPLNIAMPALSQTEDEIFYFIQNTSNIGITSDFENKNQKEIFNTPFSSFLAHWPQKDIITLQTKPSHTTEGYFYKLNPTTKSFSKILGGIKGLTALHSPLNDKVLYSECENKNISTRIYDNSKKTTDNLSQKTLPEKCVFSQTKDLLYCAVPRSLPYANYPNDWYKGITSFNDTIWKIDLSSGSTEIISDKENIDAINLFTDPEENYLFFQNKKDGTLWSLNLLNEE